MDYPERTESWLPFPGWEGWYEISDKGRFRSVDRVITDRDGGTRRCRGQILVLTPRGPYLYARLRRPGIQISVGAGPGVLTAFNRPARPGEECRHGPRGSHANWWPEDVCWGSKAENEADKLRDGTLLRGDQAPWAKLTEAAVIVCRQRRAAGEAIPVLAAEYRTSYAAMYAAVTGRRWQHLPMP